MKLIAPALIVLLLVSGKVAGECLTFTGVTVIDVVESESAHQREIYMPSYRDIALLDLPTAKANL